jgi:hypothetical protein
MTETRSLRSLLSLVLLDLVFSGSVSCVVKDIFTVLYIVDTTTDEIIADGGWILDYIRQPDDRTILDKYIPRRLKNVFAVMAGNFLIGVQYVQSEASTHVPR